MIQFFGFFFCETVKVKKKVNLGNILKNKKRNRIDQSNILKKKKKKTRESQRLKVASLRPVDKEAKADSISNPSNCFKKCVAVKRSSECIVLTFSFFSP